MHSIKKQSGFVPMATVEAVQVRGWQQSGSRAAALVECVVLLSMVAYFTIGGLLTFFG